MTIARRLYEDLEIVPVDAHNTEIAVSLLHRFFQEEGFSGDHPIIATNLDRMRRDDNHWAALALNKGHFVGIVTVTSMLYIEWGRLGEIADLYAVEVIMTPVGEAAHGLSGFLFASWFCRHGENYFAFAA